uniref:Uncharacterized protein n=1 Tax=Candidatus Kentrum sp. SD TaxID=2126332 RepID=A0A450YAZ1_9GAMM|nr:MAG: hypothetical protein BECKSD772F_GA0070984_100188 [Candidatus Kentron sp. SD]VFK38702.1 MAG: hypothetical protein BECKSD772E_GA0070983_100187 [Candidatus Kentron sp. SD]
MDSGYAFGENTHLSLPSQTGDALLNKILGNRQHIPGHAPIRLGAKR